MDARKTEQKNGRDTPLREWGEYAQRGHKWGELTTTFLGLKEEELCGEEGTVWGGVYVRRWGNARLDVDVEGRRLVPFGA